ncbi:MAG TPA: PASTA domain-containing protein [Solirubrobacterales bacterium]
MSLKRWGIIAAGLGVLAMAPGSASAAPPIYDGGMVFSAIQGPDGPEEYSWEVQLGSDQGIEQVNDQELSVFYIEDHHSVLGIRARPAHDAEGAAVPTSLRLDEGNVVTLIVHHRAGNPAAGGAPFTYPVTGGSGWEGGFQTYQVKGPPGDVPPPEPPHCVVPKLKGLTLSASRVQAKNAGCRIGAVRRASGVAAKRGHVARQLPAPGAVLAPGTAVHLRLGR